MDSALNRQVGGNHYKGFAYQPVEFICKMGCNFIQGNIIKYVTRYKMKNGKQDLEKVMHYAGLGAELSPNNYVRLSRISAEVREYVRKNNLDEIVGEVVEAACRQNWLQVVIKTQMLLYV